MSGVNVRNLEKIQDKWLLFQRFVTSIVANLVLEHKIGYLTKGTSDNIFVMECKLPGQSQLNIKRVFDNTHRLVNLNG